MENRQAVNMPLYNEDEFCLVKFGHSFTYPGHTYGPAVRPYYLVHYILSGKGIFKINQHTYHLHEGQGFLIVPNLQTVYTSDIDEPWQYIWVSFNGRVAKTVVNSLGLSKDNPVFSCNPESGEKLKNFVLEMLKKNDFMLSDIYYRWGLFFQFTSILAEAQKEFMPKADVNTYVSHMMNYINHHIEENISVLDVADYVKLARSYATTIFTKQVGMSPKSYIQNCRLTKARALLESSTLTIAEIAYSCGYAKSESLIKAFSKRYDISPGDYRKKLKAKGRHLSGVNDW